MNIYRHKENKKLYTIEYLVHDIYHLNANGFSGIYASPYKWAGEIIVYNRENQFANQNPFNPEKFVKDNFEVVAELRHL